MGIFSVVFMTYYVMYDLEDNLFCYYSNILELTSKLNYQVKEINRKFKKSKGNVININVDNLRFKVYKFID